MKELLRYAKEGAICVTALGAMTVEGLALFGSLPGGVVGAAANVVAAVSDFHHGGDGLAEARDAAFFASGAVLSGLAAAAMHKAVSFLERV